MLVASRSALPIALVPWPEMRGRFTVVLKVTYEAQPDGTLALAPRPDPLLGDTSSPSGVLLFPSDFVRSKSACDVFVVGRALVVGTPQGQPRARLKVLGIDKTVENVAALGPMSVKSGESPRVQHAAPDQRAPHPRLPFRARLEREALPFDAIVPGPTPQIGLFRGAVLELLQPAVDTIAIDPERRRVLVLVRAVVDRIDPREQTMLVVDDLAGLPAAASEIATWRRVEAQVVSAAPPAGAPLSTRPSRPQFERPGDDEVTKAFELPSSRADEEEDELTSTVTELPAGLGPSPSDDDDVTHRKARTIAAAPMAQAFAVTREDADDLPTDPVMRRAQKTIPFNRQKATTLPLSIAAPDREAPPPRPPPPSTDDEVTSVDAISEARPALPFSQSKRPSTLPPAPMAVGRETMTMIDAPESRPLPFSAAPTFGPRPRPPLVPATPFDPRPPAIPAPPPTPPAAPPPSGSAVPFSRPAPVFAASRPLEASPPIEAKPRFNVGFDLKPIVQAPAARASSLRTPSLSLEAYIEIRAALWEKKEPRRAVLKRHGLTELQWRMVERTLESRLGESKSEAKVGALVRDLASAVDRARA